MTLLRGLVLAASIAALWWAIFGPGTCGVCGKYVRNGFLHHLAEHHR